MWFADPALAICPTAIEAVRDAVRAMLVGTDGDNVNDEAEGVVE